MKTKLIGLLYKLFLKPIFFLQDPEGVHDRFTQLGRLLGSNGFTKILTRWMFNYENPELEREICGIKFKNPVGLSAGFDKDANLVNILPDVGFGFMSVGTVTYKPYKGNPKPRLYRLPKSKGLVVYYGLKNIGVKRIVKKLSNEVTKKQSNEDKFPLFISIGKTNADYTASENAGIKDYYDCLNKVIKAKVGDVYEINISCPNTFGGEPFTTAPRLEQLLKKLYTLKIDKPVFLKMPIDKKWPEFKKLCDVAVKYGVEGVIIGNLQKDHNHKDIKDKISEHVKGGISGKPTWDTSNDLISKTYESYGKKLVIVGVGGIFSADDAIEKLNRGASLVQLITGMIYHGPQLIGEINKGLSAEMNRR